VVFIVQAKAGTGYESFITTTQDTRHFFNETLNYNKLPVTSPISPKSRDLTGDLLGLVVSTSSACKVYGVKSHDGSTDGYLALPLTTESTEFFVAAWPSVFAPSLRRFLFYLVLCFCLL